MDLIPGVNEGYGMKQFKLTIFMVLASVFSGLTMWGTRDGIITMLVLAGYMALICFIWDKFLHDFKWEWHLGKDLVEWKSHVKGGILPAILAALVTFAVFAVWNYFGLWTIGHYQMPAPYFGDYQDYLYWTVFVAVYAVPLPFVEEMFWRVFCAASFKPAWTDFLISLCYALVAYSYAHFVFSSWLFALAYSGLNFVLSLILIKLRDKKNIFLAICVRVGIAVGVLLVIMVYYNQWVPRKSPTFFWKGNPENVFGGVAQFAFNTSD
jgi:hypothetical protein